MSNRSLKRFPPGIEAGRPLFQDQLTLLITWFGHVLPDYSDVVRLYDFFLAGPSLVTVYPATAIVLHRQEEILAKGNISFILLLWTCTDQPFLSECKMSAVHGLLSMIPVDLPLEFLLVIGQQRGAEPVCEDIPAGHGQDCVIWRPWQMGVMVRRVCMQG